MVFLYRGSSRLADGVVNGGRAVPDRRRSPERAALRCWGKRRRRKLDRSGPPARDERAQNVGQVARQGCGNGSGCKWSLRRRCSYERLLKSSFFVTSRLVGQVRSDHKWTRTSTPPPYCSQEEKRAPRGDITLPSPPDRNRYPLTSLVVYEEPSRSGKAQGFDEICREQHCMILRTLLLYRRFSVEQWKYWGGRLPLSPEEGLRLFRSRDSLSRVPMKTRARCFGWR